MEIDERPGAAEFTGYVQKGEAIPTLAVTLTKTGFRRETQKLTDHTSRIY